jgi:SAM-dependent methyltransferase
MEAASGPGCYERAGHGYAARRRPDPRIAAAIEHALADSRTVVNVGAGTGSYEPAGREVIAVEPSETMIAQRVPGSAPVVRAHAEALPFADGAFDASMAVLSDHHWPDRAGGLRELRRVAQRSVLFTWDRDAVRDSWLVQDYLPQFAEAAASGLPIRRIAELLGGARVHPVPIPADCADGFLHAYWARPEAYLDPRVRECISAFSLLDASAGLRRLEADLASGAWHERHGQLLELPELELGYRLLIADN